MPSRPALRRRPKLLLVAGTTAVLIAGGGATAAIASTADGSTPAPSASSRTCTPGVGRLLHALPASLKADLKHLRQDSKENKKADRAEIRKKALAGDYGMRIEHVTRIAANDHGTLIAALPAALKADLKTLRADPKGSDARKAEAAQIWQKAVAGAYGTRIEGLAKDAKARIAERCAAK